MRKTEINPSELSKALVPQVKVIDDEGNEIVRPDVLQAVVQLASLGQLSRIRKSLEKEEFEGEIDDRILAATDQLQWISFINRFPNTPWATAYFYNDGPNPVYITINEVYPTTPINMGEDSFVDFIKADTRIKRIYYWCDPGNTASVRAKGKY